MDMIYEVDEIEVVATKKLLTEQIFAKDMLDNEKLYTDE